MLDFPEAHALRLTANESRFPVLNPANDLLLRVLMKIERISLARAASGMS
ncbi:MAG TPA: hypothetical protein VI479_07025 [Blastocatellia bacterium]